MLVSVAALPSAGEQPAPEQPFPSSPPSTSSPFVWNLSSRLEPAEAMRLTWPHSKATEVPWSEGALQLALPREPPRPLDTSCAGCKARGTVSGTGQPPAAPQQLARCARGRHLQTWVTAQACCSVLGRNEVVLSQDFIRGGKYCFSALHHSRGHRMVWDPSLHHRPSCKCYPPKITLNLLQKTSTS